MRPVPNYFTGTGYGILCIVALCAAVVFVRFTPLKTLFYSDMIAAAASETSVDPLLIAAVITAETHFQVAAVSPRGAIGLMQVMPATGNEIAAESGMAPLNDAALKDPAINIRVGSLYLKRMINRYSGDLVLGLSAYNAGMGTVDRWAMQNPMLGFEMDAIPYAQTRDYVKYVLRTYQWLTKLHAFATRLHLTKP